MSNYRNFDYLLSHIDSMENLMNTIVDVALSDDWNKGETLFLVDASNFRDLRTKFLIVVAINNLIPGSQKDEYNSGYFYLCKMIGFIVEGDSYDVAFQKLVKIVGSTIPCTHPQAIKDVIYCNLDTIFEDADYIVVRDEPYVNIPAEWHPYVCDSMINFPYPHISKSELNNRHFMIGLELEEEENEDYAPDAFPYEFIDSVSKFVRNYIRDHNLS